MPVCGGKTTHCLKRSDNRSGILDAQGETEEEEEFRSKTKPQPASFNFLRAFIVYFMVFKLLLLLRIQPKNLKYTTTIVVLIHLEHY